MTRNIDAQVKNATKWSAITEITAKLVTPVTSMVLARLLTPEAYGIIATLSMIIVFAEIFTDAGFQKYIIQHEFKNDEEKDQSILVPLFVTMPCAFILRDYWALLIGTIASNLINAFVLTIYSKWKPRLYYSWSQFKEMFSFTFWSMLEAISNWLVTYFDVFVIGTILSQYYLGLYKTGSGLVTQVFSLVSFAMVIYSQISQWVINGQKHQILLGYGA